MALYATGSGGGPRCANGHDGDPSSILELSYQEAKRSLSRCRTRTLVVSNVDAAAKVDLATHRESITFEPSGHSV